MRILTVIAAVLLLGACSREAAPRPTPVSRPASTPTSRPAPSKSNPCIKASGLNGRVVYLAERGLCQHGYTFSRADEAKDPQRNKCHKFHACKSVNDDTLIS